YGGWRWSRGPKVTVFPGHTARSKKEGGIPPSQKCENPWEKALHYGFDPLKSCGFLLKQSGFMLKTSQIMLKNAETDHKTTIAARLVPPCFLVAALFPLQFTDAVLESSEVGLESVREMLVGQAIAH